MHERYVKSTVRRSLVVTKLNTAAVRLILPTQKFFFALPLFFFVNMIFFSYVSSSFLRKLCFYVSTEEYRRRYIIRKNIDQKADMYISSPYVGVFFLTSKHKRKEHTDIYLYT